jgi:hypothetical protein
MSNEKNQAKQFVQQRLEAWVMSFPGLRLRYYFEPYSDAHVVEVKPESYHNSDTLFVKAQLALMDDVESRFPEHGMVYFTDPGSAYLLGKGTIEIQANHSAVPQQ